MNGTSSVNRQTSNQRQNVWLSRAQRGLAVVFASTLLAAMACQGARAQSGKTRQSSRATSDCQSCYRLCDVGGKAQKNSAATDKCKADCDNKCQ